MRSSRLRGALPRRFSAESTSRAVALEASLLRLRPMAFVSAFRAQSMGFWFVSFFLFIEYVRPQSIYTPLAVVPWGKLSLGGAVLLCLVEGRLVFRERFLWTCVFAFTGVIVASSAAAYQPNFAFVNLNLWIIWLLAMIVVAASASTRNQLLLTFMLWCLWNFKMSQSAFRSWMLNGFRFRDWGVAGAPGWFGNSGEFGIEMCVFFPIMGYLTIGLWPELSKAKRIAMVFVASTALTGAVASSSRGALVGIAAIGVWVMLRSPQRLKAILITVILAAATYVVLPAESKERLRASGNDKTSQSRLKYWKDGLEIARAYPVLGIGYKNWIPYYRAKYDPTPELPHNLFIECVAELGFSGLLLFIMMLGGAFWTNAQTRRLTGYNARAPDRVAFYLSFGLDGAFIGYLASGFFVTVFFYPYFWINLGFTIALSRYAYGLAAQRGGRSMNRRQPLWPPDNRITARVSSSNRSVTDRQL